MKLFWRKKPDDPDIGRMTLQELAGEAVKVSDEILKLSNLNWSVLFSRSRLFRAEQTGDRAVVKIERKKMKEYISSLSGLENLRIRRDKIQARINELTGGLPMEEKPVAVPPDMSPKCESRVYDPGWRIPMSQKIRGFA